MNSSTSNMANLIISRLASKKHLIQLFLLFFISLSGMTWLMPLLTSLAQGIMILILMQFTVMMHFASPKTRNPVIKCTVLRSWILKHVCFVLAYMSLFMQRQNRQLLSDIQQILTRNFAMKIFFFSLLPARLNA